MEDWEQLKGWADNIALSHSIKILKSLGHTDEAIKKQYNLTDGEYNEIITKTVDE